MGYQLDRKVQAFLVQESSAGTKETIEATDFIPVIVRSASLEPQAESFNVDIARDSAVKNETLIGSVSSQFEFETPLFDQSVIGSAEKVFKACGYSGETSLTVYEVDADAAFVDGSTLTGGTSSETAVIEHSRTVLDNNTAKRYIFVSGASGDFTDGETVSSGAVSVTIESKYTGSTAKMLEFENDANDQVTFTGGLWEDGIFKTTFGLMGSLTISAVPKQVPIIKFTGQGIHSDPVALSAYSITQVKAADALRFCKTDFRYNSEVPKYTDFELDFGISMTLLPNANATDNDQCLDRAISTETEPAVSINKLVSSVTQEIADYNYWLSASSSGDVQFCIGNVESGAFLFVMPEAQKTEYSAQSQENVRAKSVKLASRAKDGMKIIML